ncbi:MAG: translation initiation factor [Opitutales bacterium]
MSKRKKISTDNVNQDFSDSPFSSLDTNGLPNVSGSSSKTLPDKHKPKARERLGQGERLEIRREKSGRGGKTVTTIQGFPSYLGASKKSMILKTLKTSLGTGGCWNQNTMELQGDRRSEVYNWLKESGFSPVLAGG